MRRVLFYFILSTIVFFAGCGGKEESDQPKETKKNEVIEKSEPEEKTGIKELDDFVDNMKEVQKNFEEGQKFEVVDFRELKALLPEALGDLKRTNANGEKTGTMGFTISKADADYNTEDYLKNIGIEITDISGTSGFAGVAAMGWAMADIDREDDNGYEKTTDYKGYKAHEKYSNKNQNGNFEVLIAQRFMVTVDGRGVSMDEIKNAIDKIDIGKLESMKEANPISQ